MYENVLEPLSSPQSLFSLQLKIRESPFRAYSTTNTYFSSRPLQSSEKCNLFAPKSDSQANRNIEMQTLISGTHIFRMGKVGKNLFKSQKRFVGKTEVKFPCSGTIC